jgi:NADH-quinone oxidoreductase subunit K
VNALAHNYLIVGAVLFVLGAVGFLARRNLIVMFLSAELMLQGVSLNLVGFAARHDGFQGQSFTIMLLTIAACEAGLALALIVTLFVHRPTLDVSVWQELREAGEEAIKDELPVETETLPTPAAFPTLTPAGRLPAGPATEKASHA